MENVENSTAFPIYTIHRIPSLFIEPEVRHNKTSYRTCDFLGGWGMLISIETHRTCDFLGGWWGGGGVGSGPPNPLWIHASSVGLGMLISIGTYRSCNFSVAIFLIIEQNKLYKKIQSARTIGPLSARQRTTIRR